MTREQAKATVRKNLDCSEYLTKSKGRQYCCPFCGSGNHGNGTGAFTLYKESNTWTCFACSKSGDVLDLIQQTENVDFNEALQIGTQKLSLVIDDYSAQGNAGGNDTMQAAERATEAKEAQIEAPKDYRAYYKACRQNLDNPAAIAYLESRGISKETAEHFFIGFDPAADPASAPGGEGYAAHPVPRIIIPTSREHYVGRSVDPNTEKAYRKMNNKGGRPGILNASALYSDNEAVFVVEGAFDAMSLHEVNAAAVALNSTSNAGRLIEMLAEKPTKATIIICLDDDAAGKKGSEEIKEGLRRLNIPCITANINCGQNDPNEALTADRSSFAEAVQQATHRTAARPDNVKSYIDSIMSKEIESFRESGNIKTGFANLDSKAGGLYTGLYVVAAVSSLGKTTLVHQIADQIAAAGKDVIFFSMEQSRLELVSKSLARITAKTNKTTAVSSLSIRRGNLPENVLHAAEVYADTVGERLSIVEGNFNCTVSYMADYIRGYMKRTGTQPVIVVDYLQIVQADDNKTQRRDIVDSAVTELKRISRELGLTVFVICSVNRSNYLTPIDFESLKESGGIEYTADVVWGLQFACLNEDLFSKPSTNQIKEKRERINAARAENPRQIELVCLKNRYGVAHFSCEFEYYPDCDLFEEKKIYGIDKLPINKYKRI